MPKIENKGPIWTPTCSLRFVEKRLSSMGGEYQKYLQQLWVDDAGNIEWRDVPCFDEDELNPKPKFENPDNCGY